MNKTFIERARNALKILLSRGALHIVAGTFLTKFVSFFASVFLVRCLSKSDYGILGYYENFTGYFFLAVGLGLHIGLLRYLVLAESPSLQYGYYRYALKKGTCWDFLLVFAGMVFCLLYPHPAAFAGHSTLIFLLVIGGLFIFFKHAGLASLRALFDHQGYAVLSFITAVLLILMKLAGAYAGGLNGAAAGQLLANIIGGMICVYIVKKKFFQDTVPDLIDRTAKHEISVYSIQMMLIDGLWAIFMLNDVFFLGQLCGNEVLVADYKTSYVIPANLSILVSSVGTFVSPYFTKHEHRQDYAWVQKKFKIMLACTSFIVASAVAACMVLARPLILHLYGERYLSAVPIMRILLIASFFNNGIRGPIANVLSAMGKQKYNLLAAGLGIILQVVLDLYCIPRFGPIGLAWASTAVYLTMATLLFGVFLKYYYKKS